MLLLFGRNRGNHCGGCYHMCDDDCDDIYLGRKIRMAAVCAAALGICLLFGAFIIPLLTYFGAEKARLIMMGVIAIPTVLAYVVLDKVDLSSMVFTDAQVKLILAGVIAAVILIVLLSYLISVKIFQKKEF